MSKIAGVLGAVLLLATVAWFGYPYIDEELEYQKFYNKYFIKAEKHIYFLNKQELELNVIGGASEPIVTMFNSILRNGVIQRVVPSDKYENIVLYSDYFPSTVFEDDNRKYFKYFFPIYQVPLSEMTSPRNEHCFSMVTNDLTGKFVGSLLLLKNNLNATQLNRCLARHYLKINGLDLLDNGALDRYVSFKIDDVSFKEKTKGYLELIRVNMARLEKCRDGNVDSDDCDTRSIFQAFYNSEFNQWLQ